MNEKTLKRLEYYKVLERLASFTGSVLGRERALALKPADDLEVILRWQAETSEGRDLLRLDPTAGFGGWQDIRSQLGRAGRGAVLEPEELLAVAETLTAGRLIKKFFLDREERYPLLGALAFKLVSLPELEQEIKKAVLPGGAVADTASPELARVRRKMLSTQARIREQLEYITRSPGYQKYLQDPIVTVREGRYVVPVKVEYRAQIRGLVHDQSASGATLFIEPAAVVEKNNALKRLKLEEKEEIHRILLRLSEAVTRHVEEIGAALDTLGEIDFILAKARYSRELDAWAPALQDREPFINFRQGRHPLLKGAVVPVDIVLGDAFDTLIITGPNTGGKTVTLKTAGLLVLMAQSGLHLPAGEGSRMSIFKRIFADIGDEQSIEQSLSTFSSHLTNIVDIIRLAGRESLVLLDELGAGTDPTEGAALAQAILEKLHASGAKTVATTHHSELKNFAYSRARVENASVEFDAVTLRPTYRLLTGKPGRSNAFEIAAKLGLPAAIVARAREFLTAEQVQAAELMRNLERAQQVAEEEKRQAAVLREEARRLKEKYTGMEADLARRRESVLAKAGDEAKNLVRSARQEAEAAVKELREKLAGDAARARESAIQEAREKLKALDRRVNRARPGRAAPAGEIPGALLPGEEVFLPEFNRRGYVVDSPGPAGEVQVQVGIMKVSVPLKDLRRVEKEAAVTDGGQYTTAGVMLDKAREISPELDLRGRYAEEALLEVEKYLDDACLAGLNRIRLIHGKGTGSLRAAVHKKLKGDRRVKFFRLGEHGEGGPGVTVVELS